MNCSALILLLNFGCADQKESPDKHSPEITSGSALLHADGVIYASTWVLKDLTSSALNGSTPVETFIPPQRDPAHYIPDIQTLSRLQRAPLIILNGARLEVGLDAVSLPLSKTLKSAEGLRDEWMLYPKTLIGETHHHGPEGAHSHQGIDGHTWLDPLLLRRQFTVISSRLKSLELRVSEESSHHIYDQLKRLDVQWRALAPQLRSRVVISNHPAYQYVSRRYQLGIVPLDIPPDTPPSVQQLNTLKRALAQRAELQPLMLWESSPSVEVRHALEPFKIPHVVISTLEREPKRIPKLNKPPTASAALMIYEQALKKLQRVLRETSTSSEMGQIKP